MTPGVLELPGDGGKTVRATCSPDGWDDAALAGAFPFPSTEAGEPWVVAFWEAARVTGAKVLTEPVPDPWPDGPAPSLSGNVFCPTGEGGGVDPSCSVGGGAAAGKEKFVGARVDGTVHAHAEAVKHEVARLVGGVPEELTADAGQKDKKPYDVKVPGGRGRPDQDVEVKSMTVGGKQSISVHEDALLRKVEHAARTGNGFHTVVVDDRETYNNGENKANYSGNRLYYRRGSGRFALSTMYAVKDAAELKRLIALPDHRLPEKARGSLPPPPPVAKLREAAAKASEGRKARDAARKERNKDLLREQARARAAKARAAKES